MFVSQPLYGLKQALRAWFQYFSTFLISKAFVCSKVYSSMFVYQHQSTIFVLLLYGDHMHLNGNNSTLIRAFIATLSTQFTMKDLGDLYYFLGIWVVCTSIGLFLS